MNVIRAVSFALVLMYASGLAAQEKYYKWVDENGEVHFTNNLNEVPELYRDKIKEKKFTEETPSKPPTSEGKSKAVKEVKGKTKPFSETDMEQAPAQTKGRQKKKEVDKSGHDASYWQSKYTQLKNQKKSIEASMSEARKKIYSSKISDQQEGHAEADRLKTELDRVNKQIDDLPRQVVEAGGDPGWVR